MFDDGEQLLADLAHPGARVVVARGGSPGKGNKRFATPTRQAPRFAETGLPGEELWIELRLKLLADAAMAGFPNAGKSSLLRRISNAKPKVAEYPFTTLAPVLGTVSSPDGERQLTVADVPGLIEGASEGVGLGHEFLAHLERAQMLLHVIDVTEDVEERFHAIDRELSQYGAGLDERPQVIVLNKIDLVTDVPEFPVQDERILRVYAVSCATGAGIEDLRRGLFELAPAAPPPVADEEQELVDFLVYRPRPKRERRYRIFRTDRGFRIEGHAARRRGRARRSAPLRGRATRRHGRGRRRDHGTPVSVGLLGGTFNPPHNGHVRLAETAKQHFQLDRPLRVLVAASPPHKRVLTPVEHRLALARLAFPDDDVLLDDTPYSIEAVARYGDDAIFLVGADQFAVFDTWERPDDLLDKVRLGVATRPGYPRGTSSTRCSPSSAGPSASSCSSWSRSRSRPARSASSWPGESRSTASSRPPSPPRSSAWASTAGTPATMERLEFSRTGTPDRGHRPGQARGGRRHPRHAAGLRLHRLLRRGLRPQPAADEVDLRRDPRAAEARSSPAPRATDGEREADWIVADYLDVVLHVFTPETREYYRLEDLWGDVPNVELEAAATG